MEEGGKIADGAINVCLRGPRKNLIIPGVFSCRSCEYAKARGKRTGCSEGCAVNSIFAFPTRMTVLPPLSTLATGGKKKRGCVHVTCVVRRDFARGNKIYLFSARVHGGCNEDNCKFASPRTVGWDSRTAKSGTIIENSFICNYYALRMLLNVWFIYVIKFKLCQLASIKVKI